MTPGRDHWWHELVAGQSDQAETERTAAEDPVMLIYTSGTTGRPKGAVHTHCGFPIKAAQDLAHGFDLKRDDTLYWITDMGWMMGPWEVFGALLLGASLLLYDGAPDYPDVDRLWALVERHGVTGLGISPTLIRALKPHGEEPVRSARPLDACAGSAQPARPGTPSPGCGCSRRRAAAAADHQLQRRHGDLGRHPDGQLPDPAQAGRLLRAGAGHGGGRAGRSRAGRCAARWASWSSASRGSA